jgi:hypothetical protein
MMMSYRNILADYKAADFNERLHSYMQFPHLRSEFIVIDRDEALVDLFTVAYGRRRSIGYYHRGHT